MIVILTNKVNNVGVLTSRYTNQEVVGFDITVYEGLFMNRLYTSNLYPGVSNLKMGEHNSCQPARGRIKI